MARRAEKERAPTTPTPDRREEQNDANQLIEAGRTLLQARDELAKRIRRLLLGDTVQGANRQELESLLHELYGIKVASELRAIVSVPAKDEEPRPDFGLVGTGPKARRLSIKGLLSILETRSSESGGPEKT